MSSSPLKAHALKYSYETTNEHAVHLDEQFECFLEQLCKLEDSLKTRFKKLVVSQLSLLRFRERHPEYWHGRVNRHRDSHHKRVYKSRHSLESIKHIHKGTVEAQSSASVSDVTNGPTVAPCECPSCESFDRKADIESVLRDERLADFSIDDSTSDDGREQHKRYSESHRRGFHPSPINSRNQTNPSPIHSSTPVKHTIKDTDRSFSPGSKRRYINASEIVRMKKDESSAKPTYDPQTSAKSIDSQESPVKERLRHLVEDMQRFRKSISPKLEQRSQSDSPTSTKGEKKSINIILPDRNNFQLNVKSPRLTRTPIERPEVSETTQDAYLGSKESADYETVLRGQIVRRKVLPEDRNTDKRYDEYKLVLRSRNDDSGVDTGSIDIDSRVDQSDAQQHAANSRLNISYNNASPPATSRYRDYSSHGQYNHHYSGYKQTNPENKQQFRIVTALRSMDGQPIDRAKVRTMLRIHGTNNMTTDTTAASPNRFPDFCNVPVRYENLPHRSLQPIGYDCVTNSCPECTDWNKNRSNSSCKSCGSDDENGANTNNIKQEEGVDTRHVETDMRDEMSPDHAEHIYTEETPIFDPIPRSSDENVPQQMHQDTHIVNRRDKDNDENGQIQYSEIQQYVDDILTEQRKDTERNVDLLEEITIGCQATPRSTLMVYEDDLREHVYFSTLADLVRTVREATQDTVSGCHDPLIWEAISVNVERLLDSMESLFTDLQADIILPLEDAVFEARTLIRDAVDYVFNGKNQASDQSNTKKELYSIVGSMELAAFDLGSRSRGKVLRQETKHILTELHGLAECFCFYGDRFIPMVPNMPKSNEEHKPNRNGSCTLDTLGVQKETDKEKSEATTVGEAKRDISRIRPEVSTFAGTRGGTVGISPEANTGAETILETVSIRPKVSPVAEARPETGSTRDEVHTNVETRRETDRNRTEVSPVAKKRDATDRLRAEVSPVAETRHEADRTRPEVSPVAETRHEAERTRPEVSPAAVTRREADRTRPEVSPVAETRHEADRTRPEDSPAAVTRREADRTLPEVSPAAETRHEADRTRPEVSPVAETRHEADRTRPEVSPAAETRHEADRARPEVSPVAETRREADRTRPEDSPAAEAKREADRTRPEVSPAAVTRREADRTRPDVSPAATRREADRKMPETSQAAETIHEADTTRPEVSPAAVTRREADRTRPEVSPAAETRREADRTWPEVSPVAVARREADRTMPEVSPTAETRREADRIWPEVSQAAAARREADRTWPEVSPVAVARREADRTRPKVSPAAVTRREADRTKPEVSPAAVTRREADRTWPEVSPAAETRHEADTTRPEVSQAAVTRREADRTRPDVSPAAVTRREADRTRPEVSPAAVTRREADRTRPEVSPAAVTRREADRTKPEVSIAAVTRREADKTLQEVSPASMTRHEADRTRPEVSPVAVTRREADRTRPEVSPAAEIRHEADRTWLEVSPAAEKRHEAERTRPENSPAPGARREADRTRPEVIPAAVTRREADRTMPEVSTAAVTRREADRTMPEVSTAAVTRREADRTRPEVIPAAVTRREADRTMPEVSTAAVTRREADRTRPEVSPAAETRREADRTWPEVSPVAVARREADRTRPEVSTVAEARREADRTMPEVSPAALTRRHADRTRPEVSQTAETRHEADRTRPEVSPVAETRREADRTRPEVSPAAEARRVTGRTRPEVSTATKTRRGIGGKRSQFSTAAKTRRGIAILKARISPDVNTRIGTGKRKPEGSSLAVTRRRTTRTRPNINTVKLSRVGQSSAEFTRDSQIAINRGIVNDKSNSPYQRDSPDKHINKTGVRRENGLTRPKLYTSADDRKAKSSGNRSVEITRDSQIAINRGFIYEKTSSPYQLSSGEHFDKTETRHVDEQTRLIINTTADESKDQNFGSKSAEITRDSQIARNRGIAYSRSNCPSHSDSPVRLFKELITKYITERTRPEVTTTAGDREDLTFGNTSVEITRDSQIAMNRGFSGGKSTSPSQSHHFTESGGSLGEDMDETAQFFCQGISRVSSTDIEKVIENSCKTDPCWIDMAALPTDADTSSVLKRSSFLESSTLLKLVFLFGLLLGVVTVVMGPDVAISGRKVLSKVIQTILCNLRHTHLHPILQ